MDANQSVWGPGPTIVAVGILALVGTIAVSAIFRYDTVDDALKFWSALSGLIGVVTGALVTYFFTRETVQAAQQAATALQDTTQQAQQQATQAQQQANQAQQQAAQAQQQAAEQTRAAQDSKDALTATFAKVDPTTAEALMAEPAVQRVLG